MKKLRSLALLTAVLLILGMVSACGAQSAAPAASQPPQNTAEVTEPPISTEPVNLVMWNSFFTGPNDSKMDKKDWYITQAIQRFQQTYPNISVEVSTVTAGLDTIAKFKAAGVAQNGPDIATLWSCSYSLAVKQFLLPLDSYLTADDRNNITQWWTVREGLVDDGPVTYGYPNNDTGITCIFYNKALVKAAGLNFDANPPKTMQAFTDACQAIKDTGVVPITMTMKDGGAEAYMVPYWFGQAAGGTAKFVELMQGKTTFSKEPAFIAADKAQKDLYDKGYINTDVLSLAWGELDNRFLAGKTAMVVGGSWYISAYEPLGADLGMIPFPSISDDAAIQNSGIGGAGILVGVTTYCKHPNEAVKFIQFLESKDEMIAFAKYSPGIIPNRKDIDINAVTDNALLKQQAQWENNGIVVWLDNVMPGEWAAEWFKLAPLYMTGKLSEADYLQKLDEKQAETLGK